MQAASIAEFLHEQEELKLRHTARQAAVKEEQE